MASKEINNQDNEQNSEEQQSYEELVSKKEKLEEELKQIETQIYRLESSYLEETWPHGNVVKGWDGFASNRRAPGQKKSRFKDTDRLFSYSSATSSLNQKQE
eukprot:gb/GECH01001252.1/.p1 GENE.gb/GECH01001252.1/~~gb/GECH01001252.1/.p1  ORF type:complete len:102 (+),score=44.17 gb/GECH01001252.1/:1-306(+)